MAADDRTYIRLHDGMDEPSGLLWLGDPGCRDAPDEQRARYVGPAKVFCPCDLGRPNECDSGSGDAHIPLPPCERCGLPLYQHQRNYCRRPTPWAPRLNDDWIWWAIQHPEVPWIKRAVDTVRDALRVHAAVRGDA